MQSFCSLHRFFDEVKVWRLTRLLYDLTSITLLLKPLLCSSGSMFWVLPKPSSGVWSWAKEVFPALYPCKKKKKRLKAYWRIHTSTLYCGWSLGHDIFFSLLSKHDRRSSWQIASLSGQFDRSTFSGVILRAVQHFSTFLRSILPSDNQQVPAVYFEATHLSRDHPHSTTRVLAWNSRTNWWFFCMSYTFK